VTARLLLIAHGATAATRAAAFPRDEPLDPGAVAATRALASGLPLSHPRTQRTSGPERRCAQTSTALAPDVNSDGGPGWLEVADLSDWDAGRWAGQTLDAVSAAEPDAVQAWLQDPDAAPHGGESLTQLLHRTGAWLDARPPTSRTIAVTHPAVLRAAAVHALTAGPAAFWRIDVPPLATLSLTGTPGRWSVRLP